MVDSPQSHIQQIIVDIAVSGLGGGEFLNIDPNTQPIFSKYLLTSSVIAVSIDFILCCCLSPHQPEVPFSLLSALL